MVSESLKKNPSCGSCFFAIKNKNPMAIGHESGECRRFPPQIVLVQGTPVISWPIVNNDPRLYCGEWKERIV